MPDSSQPAETGSARDAAPRPHAAGNAAILGEADAKELESALGYAFRDRGLLVLSLSHRSWVAEQIVPAGQERPASNERLEFLGDSVLGMAVTDYIFARYPGHSEGELAKVRAAVVNAGVLAELAAELGLGEAILLGKGEAASGGREKPTILSDVMEAVFGAVYLDGGWRPAERLILGLLEERMQEAAKGPGGQDYKTRLQEIAARRLDQLPVYRIREEGPDHAKKFFAEVSFGGRVLGVGEGRSKKQAEQAAAKTAWEGLERGADEAGGLGEGALDAEEGQPSA